MFSNTSFSNQDLNDLKEKIFKTFLVIRIYTKEPKKEKSLIPIIIKQKCTVKEIAEKIFGKNWSIVKQTKLWGPSSKFPGQTVGLEHELKDNDVVEFQTR